MEDFQSNQHGKRGVDNRILSAGTTTTAYVDPNLRRLAQLLIDSEFVQRAALSKRSGLARQVVSDLMAELEVRGLVRVEGRFDGNPGRSNLSYALAADAAAGLAYDVGGTKIGAALIDLRGTILAERTEPTTTGSLDALMGQIDRLAGQLCADAGLARYRVRSAAIGLPGATNPRTRQVGLASNLGVISASDLSVRLEEAIGCRVRMENDVNLALIGEVASGAGQGIANIAFIALGTGIGSGLMIDGRLVRGYRGAAGELAFLPVDGFAGMPSHSGDLEERVGGAGVVAAYRRLGGEEAEVADIFVRAEAGEPAAAKTIEGLSFDVARAIAALVAVADPQLVVMGGAIGARHELISRIVTHLPTIMRMPVLVVRTAAGPRAGLVGAIEVARLDLLTVLFGAGDTAPAR